MVFWIFAFAAVITSPTLIDGGLELSTTDGDASIAFHSFGFGIVVIACSDGSERTSAEQDLGATVEALATIAATLHVECACSHDEVVVALDAGCRCGVCHTVGGLNFTVASGADCGATATNGYGRVAFNATPSIGCYVNVQ